MLSIRLFIKISNGVSHRLINAAVSEIQRLEHSHCTEIVVKWVNIHRFSKFLELPSKHLDEQLLHSKLLIGITLEIYH